MQQRLAELTGTDLRYDALEFHLWPAPLAEFHHATVRLAPDVDLSVERVSLRFKWLPLLRGDARLSLIRLERPALTARLTALGNSLLDQDVLATYRSVLGPASEWLATHATGTAFELRGGSADLSMAGAPLLRLDDVVVDASVSSDSIDATLSSRANLWRHARAKGHINNASLAAQLELAVDGLDAAPAFNRALGAASLEVFAGPGNVALAAETDGLHSATARLSMDLPTLGVARDGSRFDFDGSNTRLRASYSALETTLVVEQLQLGGLLPAASGSFSVQPGVGATVLEAAVPRVDIGRLRAVLLGLAGDLGLVRKLATFVQAGVALDLHVHAAGSGLGALAEPGAYELSMGAQGATIDVPALGQALTGAAGQLHMAQQVLSARDVTATVGRSTLHDGKVVLALSPTLVVRDLSAGFDIDLTESHQHASRLLRASDVVTAFSQIQSVAGRAQGSMVLRQVGSSYQQAYDITSLHGTLRHAAVPLPIVVDAGALRIDSAGALTLRGLAGKLGASRFERLDAALDVSGQPLVRSATGSARLALDELYPWLAAMPEAATWRDGLSALSGSVGVTLTRLAGPLHAPERLDVAAVLSPQQVRIVSPHWPEALSLSGGTMRIEGTDIGFEGVAVAMDDAQGRLSGSLRAYALPARALDVAIADGIVGSRMLGWAEDLMGVAAGARLRAPLAIPSAHLRWPAPAPWRFAVDATAVFPSGTRCEVDASWAPKRLALRRFTLNDPDSDARVTLDWQPRRAALGFQGVVSGRSVDRMLVLPPGASGALRGDFNAMIDLRDPLQSHATGKLAGTDVSAPGLFDLPLHIDRMSVEAEGQRIAVRDTMLRVAGEPLIIAGTLTRTGSQFDVDADIQVDGIDTEGLLAKLRPPEAGAASSASAATAADTPEGSPWEWPLRGRVALRAGHIDAYGYRLAPFVAALTLGDHKVSADVTEARLCSLALPFTLVATPGVVDMKARATAQDLAVAETVACLTKGKLRATGTLDFSADFAARAAPGDLLASAQGSARLRARNGQLGGLRVESEIIELDDVVERLAAAEPARDGLQYDVIEVDTSLVNGRLAIDRGLLRSPALTIAVQGDIQLADGQLALTGVAVPIVNAALTRVPVLGRLVGDPIVGIPFGVTGSVADPQVNRIAAGAIAGTLVRTLQSVVSQPVRLLGGNAAEGETAPGDPP